MDGIRCQFCQAVLHRENWEGDHRSWCPVIEPGREQHWTTVVMTLGEARVECSCSWSTQVEQILDPQKRISKAHEIARTHRTESFSEGLDRESGSP